MIPKITNSYFQCTDEQFLCDIQSDGSSTSSSSVMELMTVMMDMMRIPSTVTFGLVKSSVIACEVQFLICTQMHT